ncbi:hypothetical protein ACFU99_14225 [Streptomyces sp. NPDC057654]|uniref:hypothetical protein n=1 Tax=Streptomyces sp. NPDC057654 TaxID=3346196 RepID=UPI0036980EA9
MTLRDPLRVHRRCKGTDSLLEQNERHRLDALFGSLAAGRVDDVVDALMGCRNSHVIKVKPQ